MLLDEKYQSKIITAIFEPECAEYNFEAMHDYLYQRGFTIYPGKVSAFKTFRVANMGAINSDDIKAFLKVLEYYLKSINYI